MRKLSIRAHVQEQLQQIKLNGELFRLLHSHSRCDCLPGLDLHPNVQDLRGIGRPTLVRICRYFHASLVFAQGGVEPPTWFVLTGFAILLRSFFLSRLLFQDFFHVPIRVAGNFAASQYNERSKHCDSKPYS